MQLKVGSYIRTLNYYLGDLKIASIRHDHSYGISYGPTKQYEKHYVWLMTPFQEVSTKCTSVGDAIARLRNVVGGIEHFSLLRQDESNFDDIALKIIPDE